MSKKYLETNTNYTTNRLLSIAFETYLDDCKIKVENLGKNYDPYIYKDTIVSKPEIVDPFITKFTFNLIKHPTEDKYALEINDDTLLNATHKNKTKSHSEMESLGWFNSVLLGS